MYTIIIDVPRRETGIIHVPMDAEVYIHFKEDVTFCNNNRDAFAPYLPCNIFFKAGEAWGPAVPVQDADGVDVGFTWNSGHERCKAPCEPVGRKKIVFDGGGHVIHVGSGGKLKR